MFFVIPTRPVPKERPRMSTKGRRAYLYTPEKTLAYEEYVGLVARKHVKEPLTCKVTVGAEMFFRRGKRMPDLDNCIKSLLDGMNGIVYVDDRQVRRINAEMHEVAHAEQERTEVYITEWQPKRYRVSWRERRGSCGDCDHRQQKG